MTESEIDKILFGIGVDSFNRFQAFLKLVPQLNGQSYWYALRNSYDSSDNLYDYRGLVRACFLKNEPNRQSLMGPDEIEYLRSLPSKLTIYRGMTVKELNQDSFGISWTLKKDVAEFFSKTYQRNYATKSLKTIVHEVTIDKKEAIAYFNNRNEFEIIYIKT